MSQQVMTEVSASVGAGRETELITAFREMSAAGTPDGLLRTELLCGPDGEWRIQTLWRDRAALDAMREGPEPPVAPQLFRQVGAEPSLRIYQVAHSRSVAE